LLVRVAGSGTRVAAFHARLGDHPAERGLRLARAGLWAEAEAEYAEACRRVPDDNYLWRLHVQLLWAAGKQDETRGEVGRRLRQYQATNQWWTAIDILQVAALVPEQRPEETRMADLVKAYLDGMADRPTWLLHGTGTAYLGVGKWDTAAKLLEESLAKSDDPSLWPSLALAYHHLGERKKAVDLIRKSEEWWARALGDKLEHPDLHLPRSSLGMIPFLSHLEQARAALKIKPGPAPDFADLQAIHRKMLAETRIEGKQDAPDPKK
jgi:tetratricopeptide (TPR) repeat protein